MMGLKQETEMPSLVNHPSSKITKLLLMGDPGSGKTGGLAALANAGYKLHIADLDNGLDVLVNMLSDRKSPYSKEAIGNIDFQTITERHVKISAKGGVEVPPSATVWNRLVAVATKWPDGGSVNDWNEEHIFVLDSMTLAGIAAYNFAAVANVANKNQDNRMTYFHAQQYLEHLIQCLFSDDVKCNIIITSHITFLGDENNIQHGFPTTIGSRLSSKIGRYFNSVLMMKTDNKNHWLYTVPSTTKVELKSSAPLRVKERYDIKFGLAEYFKDVQSQVGFAQ